MSRWSTEEALRRRQEALNHYNKETKGKSDKDKADYLRKHIFKFGEE
jgi:hypothetical protein